MQPEENDPDRQRFRSIRRGILVRVLLPPFLIVMVVFFTVITYFGANLRSRVFSELALIAEDHRNMSVWSPACTGDPAEGVGNESRQTAYGG